MHSHQHNKENLLANRSGMCTDTVLYLDRGCSFQVDMVEDETTITISGGSGTCHLVATDEAALQLHTLLRDSQQERDSLDTDDLNEGARYTLVPRTPRISHPRGAGRA